MTVLPDLGGGDKQGALPKADGGDQVDEAAGEVLLGADGALQAHLAGGMKRGEVFELRDVLVVFRRLSVDGDDAPGGEALLLAVLGLALAAPTILGLGALDLDLDLVAGAQIVAPDEGGGDVDVLVAA